jgi:E3 ubiquitin-protein ligase MYCBP2
LVHEGNDKDLTLSDKVSPYYNNPEKYAMTIYAYFQCFKCNEPYFGGRKSCAEAMVDAASEKFDPK